MPFIIGEKIKVRIDPNDGMVIRKGLMIKDPSKKGFRKPKIKYKGE